MDHSFHEVSSDVSGMAKDALKPMMQTASPPSSVADTSEVDNIGYAYEQMVRYDVTTNSQSAVSKETKTTTFEPITLLC